ncbi:MAG: hypothetical protein BWY32_02077 [bacterium ADurb.Bin243]|nr:MAG: hypothetical protein BWY32_02077 [bacterium ADurb.Bin243]
MVAPLVAQPMATLCALSKTPPAGVKKGVSTSSGFTVSLIEPTAEAISEAEDEDVTALPLSVI